VEATPPEHGIEEVHPAEAEATRVAPEAPASDDTTAAAEGLVAKRTRGQIAAAVAWNSLIAIAILLTLATIALTIAGIVGVHL
jgi:hypothetical protein